ncbi:MAG: RNA-binding S4 domain-containing protein [Desulfobulbus sp.]|nr:RNA-binding S4 domain-containing protein [Desulfobulbus sp.]
MQEKISRLVSIRTSYIELDKLLKRENMTVSGGEAKFFINQGAVRVNGLRETRKRRKLYPGDTVDFNGVTLCIASTPSCSALPDTAEQED